MNRSRFTIAMPAVTTANTAAKRAVLPVVAVPGPAVLAPAVLSLAALVSITPSVTRPPVATARTAHQHQRASISEFENPTEA
jgi:hypothetical protein